MNRINTVCIVVVLSVRRVPLEVKLIAAKQRAITGVGPVANDIDKVKLHQRWYVLRIANVRLIVGISNRDCLICWILQFKHRHRDAVNKQNYIRTAIVVLLKLELVDGLKDIDHLGVRAKLKEVDKLISAVIPVKNIPTGKQLVGLFHGSVQGLVRVAGDIGDQGVQFIIREVTVLPIQIILKIRKKYNIVLFSMDIIPALVFPAAVFKQFKDGQFIVVFIIFEICHIIGLLPRLLLLPVQGKSCFAYLTIAQQFAFWF